MMNYTWYKASDGTEWTNKDHMERYEEECRLAKAISPLLSEPIKLAAWILDRFERIKN